MPQMLDEQTGSTLFYGWYIVAMAFIANFMSVGTGFYLMNAFMEPLCDARHWTRTDVSLALGYATVFSLMAQMVFGTIVNRIGARTLMLTGSFVAGIAFFLLFRAESLWQFYLLFIVLYIGNAAYGGIVTSTSVNNWFIIKRGHALGMATAGVSFSGAVLPPLAMVMILHMGMEPASAIISLLVILVGPIAWMVVKNWPEDMGLSPDGIDSTPGVGAIRQSPEKGQAVSPGPGATFIPPLHPLQPWPIKRLVRSNAFWKIGMAYALLTAAAVGVMSQLKPRFADIGFEDMTAMWLMAGTAFVGALGKYAWGIICDHFEIRRVAALVAVLNGIGLLFSFISGSPVALILFMVIFGFTMGGIMSTYPILIADYFGREAFPSVVRFTSLFLVMQMVGFLLAGQSFDRTGSYGFAYALFIMFDMVAAGLIWSIAGGRKTENRRP
jgi:OFA family oxalate/formate antiporter-like MFS transporter